MAAPRTTRKGSVTTISFSGPFFEHDPRLTFRANARKMLAALAREGESDVQAQIPTGKTGKTKRGVKGRTASTKGKPWAMTGVVSQTYVYPWPHGGARQYRGGRLEAKLHMFRKTTNRLRKSRKINAVELMRGIA